MYKDELSTERLSDFSGIVGDFTGQQGRIAYWAQEGRVDQLKALNAQGLSASQIAKQMGDVTRNAVIGKLHRMGISNGARVMRTYAKSRPKSRAKDKIVKQPFATSFASFPLPPEPTRPAKLVRMIDLEDDQCRFPYGDPKHGEFGFCGCKKMIGSPYCRGHHGTAYTGPAVRKPPADIVRNIETGRAYGDDKQRRQGRLKGRRQELAV